MLDIDKFYEEYGLTDDSIKLLLEYHPYSYISFLYKYITLELYETNTEQVSKWLNQIYANACTVDMSFSDLGVVYQHALLISDFKFRYTSGHSLDWCNVMRTNETAEHKVKILNYFKVEPSELIYEITGWPGKNNLNFILTDYKIIKDFYPLLVPELINNKNLMKQHLYAVYGILEALVDQYKNSPDELLTVKQASLLMFGHACIKDDSYPLLDQIGKELYGDKFEHIYKTGESLDLLSSPDFWEANRHHLTSHELPDLAFNH